MLYLDVKKNLIKIWNWSDGCNIRYLDMQVIRFGSKYWVKLNNYFGGNKIYFEIV